MRAWYQLADAISAARSSTFRMEYRATVHLIRSEFVPELAQDFYLERELSCIYVSEQFWLELNREDVRGMLPLGNSRNHFGRITTISGATVYVVSDSSHPPFQLVWK